MIYTLTPNPALDYNVYPESFELGKINRAKKGEIFCGGKGINVSSVLNTLKVENVSLGFVAGFTGKELEKRLELNGIKTDFITLSSGITRINVKIRTHCETDINLSGAAPTEKEIDSLFAKISENLKQGDILCLCGNVQSELGDDFYERLAKVAAKNKAKIAVDATKNQLLNTLKYNPVLIKPNLEELCEIAEKPLKTDEEIIAFAKYLCDLGAENTLVTLGDKGAIAVNKEKEAFKVTTPEITPKNTVGAGDSAFAGFLAEYQKGDFKRAIAISIACGTATAKSEGLCTTEQIEKILKEVTVQKIG